MKPRDQWPNQYIVGNQGADGALFLIKFEGRNFAVVASNGGSWDHVSVSLPNRCPNWREMCFVKQLFWNDDEVVIQYHPAKQDYINNCPTCLHMWKPQNEVLPMPDKIMVGI